MKSLRRRAAWIILFTIVFVPILASGIWYGRQFRQQRLDHALIAAIKKEDTPAVIALLNQGADANAVDKPEKAMTLKGVLADFWNRLKGNKPKKDTEVYPSALFRVVHQPIVVKGNPIISLIFPQEHPNLVEALLAHGANPNTLDEEGNTVLHCACRANLPKTVKVLLEHRADPSVKNRYGVTPLMFACLRPIGEDLTCVHLLIENGADVNAKDTDGGTVLLYVVRLQPSADTVRCLLAHGANVSIKDKVGVTAMDYAKRYQDEHLIPLLEEAVRKEHHKDVQK